MMEDKYSKKGGIKIWADPRIPVVDNVFKMVLNREEQ